MLEDSDSQETQSLGDYLRRQREEAGMTVEALCLRTRISSAILRAMEADNYAALPAHAFARGFYALYAKSLALNDQRIVNWYGEERRRADSAAEEHGGLSTQAGGSAIHAAAATHHMASARHAQPFVTFIIIIVALAVLAALLCWRFEVNPVMVIREKIHLVQMRSLQRERHFRIPNTSKVIRRTDEKKKTLVTLNGER
ncbi:MAG: helix-turn-helix domain-containing protein [Desulfobulbaceae bacterium]|jgi:cytoskeletal protein RodZ|nr:helix-turn-helix domain-containing protein [Desulfobulbaceae bacterium]